jgi:surface antigen
MHPVRLRRQASPAWATPLIARRPVITVLVLALVLGAGTAVLISARPAAADTLGYPDWNMPCEHSPYSVTGACANYDWGPTHTEAYNDPSEYSSRGYTYRNCTDYVAWKLQSLGVPDGNTRSLGNADTWYSNAPASERSSVAAYGEAAVSTSGEFGHVAFVESVDNSNNTMVVSEYNEDGLGDGDTRTVSIASGEFTEYVNFGLSSTPPPSTTTTVTPARAAVTAALSSSANPSSFGQSVTLTATIVPQAASTDTPSGAARIFDGGTEIGSGNLSGGPLSVTISSLSVGTHPITASYDGDSNFLSSDSPTFDQVVDKAATTTTLTSSANPSVFGQRVTYTATVAPSAGSGNPTGTVQFFDGTTPIGSGTLSNGTYSMTPPSLAVGSYPLTATYSGDNDFLTSISPVLNQTVNKAPTKTALAATPTESSGFGHPVTFTATLSVPPPGAGSPTGAIAFSVDGTKVAQTPLAANLTAIITTSALAPGSHVIDATYSGDTNFLASGTALAYLVTCTVNLTGNHPGALTASGDSTCVVDATVGGAIVVPKGTSLAVINSTVGGAITASSIPDAIEVCGSHFIGGATDIINAQGLVIIGDPGDANCAANTIGGTLLLLSNTHGLEAINNTVGGLVTSGNSGPGPFPGDISSVSGNHPSH